MQLEIFIFDANLVTAILGQRNARFKHVKSVKTLWWQPESTPWNHEHETLVQPVIFTACHFSPL